MNIDFIFGLTLIIVISVVGIWMFVEGAKDEKLKEKVIEDFKIGTKVFSKKIGLNGKVVKVTNVRRYYDRPNYVDVHVYFNKKIGIKLFPHYMTDDLMIK